jgi:transcriptional regulator with XRE-family HTH domain
VRPERNRRSICQKVAALLQAERERQRMSMTMLGERAGLSQQSVSYIERGLRIPNLDTLFRLAEALDCELGALIAKAEKTAKRGKD